MHHIYIYVYIYYMYRYTVYKISSVYDLDSLRDVKLRVAMAQP